MSKENYTIVAKELVNKMEDLLSGNSEDFLFGRKPENVVLLGSIKAGLTSTNIFDDDFVVENDYQSAPSLGVNFHKEKDKKLVTIKLYGKFYYRVLPTFAENTRYYLETYSQSEGRTFTTAKELQDYIIDKKAHNPDYQIDTASIINLFKGIQIADANTSYKFDFSNAATAKYSLEKYNEQLNKWIEELSDRVTSESYYVKTNSQSILDILDETKFNALVKSKSGNIKPKWSLKCYLNFVESSDYDNVIFQVTNSSSPTKELSDTFDSTIYDVKIELSGDNVFKNIKLNEIKHNYLSPSDIYGLGLNCSVEHDGSSASYLKTTNFPKYNQYRVNTVATYDAYITFDALIKDPISNLTHLKEAMEASLNSYKKEYQQESKDKPKGRKTDLENDYFTRFEEEIESFENEIYRFGYGISLINNKVDVRNAFRYMNETFKSAGKYPGWRMFQIVFIVSEIADICNSEYEGKPNFESLSIDLVDVLYFPTGGGKTESFLGCSFFAAFFDRLRGKYSGITAFIKYPLRLLTAQQLDRVLKLVMLANNIKRKYTIPGKEFNTGFYTGAQNTPNKISDEILSFVKGPQQQDINNKYRQIDECPCCKSTNINVRFDEDTWSLEHVCDNCGVLPVSIVDDEIYRRPPTFVISTIDKMANFGLTPGFKTMFGKNNGWCPKHGYVFSERGCTCEGCKETVVTPEPVKDPVPTLFIQDELHLLNESLGTFDSHYERLIQYYCENLAPKKKKIKFIGATATISQYKAHCYNLYLKNSICFPTSIKGKNFYSYVDEADLNRILVGTKLYSKSVTDAIQKVITYYRMMIFEMARNATHYVSLLEKKGFTGTEKDLKIILNDYLISILYCNSKDDAGRVQGALENQGKLDLERVGIDEFKFGNITGDVDFKQIKNVMHEIEIVGDKNECKNMIIATSAISHGVDEDSFNNIFFYGMPNKTAEYIQAYSRVGRKYTGLVFDIMRIVRDRDMSYLKNFDSFHRYKDMMIEPVPIQRWAKNAVYNTLPGIISALLIQHYCFSSPSDVQKAINSNPAIIDDIKTIVLEVYGCNFLKTDGLAYSKVIEAEVNNICQGFVSYRFDAVNKENNTISKVITDSNSIRKRPMTSLRDVDVQLRFKRVA